MDENERPHRCMTTFRVRTRFAHWAAANHVNEASIPDG
jgi:hypothetical protein